MSEKQTEVELAWCRKEIERLRKLVCLMSENACGRYVVVEWDASSSPLRPTLAILVSDDDDAETMAESIGRHLVPMLRDAGVAAAGDVGVRR